jgi:tetratricopeptide (TPR) repeat protein/mono/diheme cytochrome c family protein
VASLTHEGSRRAWAGLSCALAVLFPVVLSAQPAPPPASSPTFGHDIAPILARHCVTCHHPGVNGAFSLLTYDDARPRARAIAAATSARYMPPWKPDRGYGEAFLAARGLTDDEIATIRQWADAGAPQGRPVVPQTIPDWTDSWRLGTPDLVIRMPEPFEIPASGPDVFRLFVLPIPIGAVRYVRGIEFMPGTRAVHHANMRLDETPASRELDAKDPAPGYDGLLAPSANYPDGYFFGWTPGQLPPTSADLAWRLNPGTDLVLQLHMRPTGKPERVQAAIGLFFAPGAPRLTPAMLRLGKQNIDIAAGQRDYEITDSYVLPVDVDVHGVQPHAHYRAKEITGFATLPDGTRKGLIRISDWDFDWQDTYRYVKPVPLPKGTTLTMRYTYDNSDANRRNPQLPPQRVHWGQNSSDEMGDLWIQVVPRSPADHDQLVREFRQKVFREDILGYETALQRTPRDVALHDDVALLYLAVGRAREAVDHFAASARLTPDVAATHFNLGTALVAAGRRAEAIDEYRQALRIAPDYAHAHNNLGSLLMAALQLDEARSHFQRALAIDPSYAEAHNNLGKLLAYEGRTAEAAEHLRQALSIRDAYPEAHYNLAQVFVTQGRALEAVREYAAALARLPDWLPALSELAWIRATHPDSRVRDAREAVSLAEHARVLASDKDPTALDVLAAAYAAAGRFDEAIVCARSALDLLAGREAASGRSELNERSALYQQRQPYLDTRGRGPVRPSP